MVSNGAMRSLGTQVHTLDLIVMLVGLASLVAMSLYFARRSKRTEDYFVGGRSFAGWALGLSMLGTVISSNTFLALPARPTRSTGDNSA